MCNEHSKNRLYCFYIELFETKCLFSNTNTREKCLKYKKCSNSFTPMHASIEFRRLYSSSTRDKTDLNTERHTIDLIRVRAPKVIADIILIIYIKKKKIGVSSR